MLSLDTTLEPIRAARDSLKRVEAFEGYPDAFGMAEYGREMIEEVTDKLLQMLSARHINASRPGSRQRSRRCARTSRPRQQHKPERSRVGAGGYMHVAAQTKSSKLRASGGGGAGGGVRGAGREEQQANMTCARNIVEKNTSTGVTAAENYGTKEGTASGDGEEERCK